MYHYFICYQQRDNQLNCDTMLSYLINFKMHLAFWNVKTFLKMHIVASMKYGILSLNTQQLIRSLNSELTLFRGKALDTQGPHCYHFILRGEIFKETVSLGVYSPFLRENCFLVHSLFLDDKSGKINFLWRSLIYVAFQEGGDTFHYTVKRNVHVKISGCPFVACVFTSELLPSCTVLSVLCWRVLLFDLIILSLLCVSSCWKVFVSILPHSVTLRSPVPLSQAGKLIRTEVLGGGGRALDVRSVCSRSPLAPWHMHH